ncbi:MAG TPA: 2,3,4,5-tetrahydropyridine-2,6-dicarboxylate N-succinyltransferase, partial [Chloroflexota bacterium]|nr:2,3,4,5-tetrahydropyridine-2,6-dicarboxylate N-succinyltransferase [Chloroflexota bacterium]
MSAHELQPLVEAAFDNPGQLKERPAVEAVEETIAQLDRGTLRVATKEGSEWLVHEWVKKAVLLYFQLRGMETIELGPYEWHDKIPLKHGYEALRVRAVPP